MIPIRRALLSVSDKTDIVAFARALASRGVTIISTGGTSRMLSEAGIDVVGIEQVTGFPEIMDGRVKTLHPIVHGGLLARRDVDSHVEAMKTHGIEPIDLVCVNLYPFERTMRQESATRKEIIEQIDIGGPSMIRSAAKNFEFVTVVTSPDLYDRIVTELDAHDGCTSMQLREELAAAAFSRTADYDATIAGWMYRRHSGEILPDQYRVNMTKVMDLRYGENPHLKAALYRDPSSRGPTVVNADRLHGKPLSYNNLNDAASALALALELPEPGAAVIKHTNACGAAVGSTLCEAFNKAYSGDSMAAYGGILAVNVPLDLETAKEIAGDKKRFFEVIVAPAFDEQALHVLQERWTSVRLLAVGSHKPSPYRKMEFRSIPGGMLVQDQDLHRVAPAQWSRMAGPEPTAQQVRDAELMWSVCKHLKSNAIAVGGNGMLYGAGAGQMDRVTSCRLAVQKAGDRCAGAVAASDAFFPFSDGPEELIKAGVKVIVQPGGSKRDELTLSVCEEHGVTCLFTGIRHFRH
ncbi:MAG: bifunctional phosphoribosylaminoimidazolecarboxamide formyltransferase/IMP cyclohydrolase PurH [Planctomycetes bacterium]|nr:bifunctional phosphoribosylaminoimidazolecarboxamide formyltransferase/IMP cyclohydrolase PurH [Planctomycetota bacterium]NOG52918.1 bifunctional phosphoribosylaminoimidazolecarboxamide formyltransferase/IMP cyclohydrolase [Planctomycetota bacterium]